LLKSASAQSPPGPARRALSNLCSSA
jgi:hypothetical protein